MCRMVRWVLGVAVAAACFLVAETALAEVATVRLKNGTVVTGDVEEYDPATRIVLRLESGETVTILQVEIATVEFLAPAPAPPMGPVSPFEVQPAQAQPAQPAQPYPQQPYSAEPTSTAQLPASGAYASYESPPQPSRRPGRMPSLAPVFVMGGVGLSLAIAGAVLFTSPDPYSSSDCGYYDEPCLSFEQKLGVGFIAGGVAVLGLSLGLVLPLRLRARRRARAQMGLSLVPVVDPTRERYGVAGTLRF